MMSLHSELTSLFDELERTNRLAIGLPENEFPGFLTTKTGHRVIVSNNNRDISRRLASIIHANRLEPAIRVELEAFVTVLVRTAAEMYAEAVFTAAGNAPQSFELDEFKLRIEAEIVAAGNEYTHHMPAWTLGMEKDARLTLGPVQFSSRDLWIDKVDFSPGAKDFYGQDPAINGRWKDDLRAALALGKGAPPLPLLAGMIHDVVRSCPAMLTVTIRGFEMNFSAKVARIVCKAALDAISLCFENPKIFRQQILHDERVPPFSISTLIETNGFLHLPGMELKRMPELSPQDALDAWNGMQKFQDPIAAILHAMLDPSSHSYPQLAARWATALDWFAEGCREPNDAVALAKVATSLDVLASGGKAKGILEMVSHLTGLAADGPAMKSGQQMTLAQVIKQIYDFGRSQILHGNHYDRLKPFARERSQATQIATAVLLEAALRLFSYNGPNDDKAFRAMR